MRRLQALLWLLAASAQHAWSQPVPYGDPAVWPPHQHLSLRSLTEPTGPRGVDELDLPRREERQNHRGFEYRSRHFVVTSTRSADEARSAAEELEATWNKIADLADYWTAVHREPSFGIGAVGVWLSDEPWHDGTSLAINETNQFLDFYVSTRGDDGGNEQRVPQELRRQAWHGFVRVADLEDVWPNWIRDGMANYFAANGDLDALPVATSAHEASRNTMEDGVAFLMLANDATNAPRLLEAMRTSVTATLTARHSAPTSRAPFQWVPEVHRDERLTDFAGSRAEDQLRAWRTDRTFGQAEVTLPESLSSREGDDVLAAHVGRLTFLLRLAAKLTGFASESQSSEPEANDGSIVPRITSFANGKPARAHSLPSGRGSAIVTQQAASETVQESPRDASSGSISRQRPAAAFVGGSSDAENAASDESDKAPVEVASPFAEPLVRLTPRKLLEMATDADARRWAAIGPSGAFIAWKDRREIEEIVLAAGCQYAIAIHSREVSIDYRTDRGESFRASMRPTAEPKRPFRITVEKVGEPKIEPATAEYHPTGVLRR